MSIESGNGAGFQNGVVGPEEKLRIGDAPTIDEAKPMDESESEMLLTAMALLGKAIEKNQQVNMTN